MKEDLLTIKRLKELLIYDIETGFFIWKKNGLRAGWNDSDGYRKIQIDGVYYREHRLAWFYVYLKWPSNEIDHRDGVRNNNRILNLRDATRSQNRQNLSIKTKWESKTRGCSWHKKTKKWQAYIIVNKKWYALGYFNSREEAGSAYLTAKQRLHTFQPTPRDMENA